MYISSFLQLWTKNKSKNIQKSKKSKKSKVIFSDFYCLINTKFWITNEKMFIKKKIIFSDVYCFISTIVNYK